MEFKISNEKKIKQAAHQILKESLQGERPIVLALKGELGAGKTTFVKFLAQELGIEEIVTSPTFLLMRVLKLPKKKHKITRLVHIDAYRIELAEELFDLGLKDILKDERSVIVIEWPEKLSDYLPPQTIYIEFEITGEKERIIKILNSYFD